MRRREVLTVGAEGLKSASSENFYQNILRDLSIGNFWIINTDNWWQWKKVNKASWIIVGLPALQNNGMNDIGLDWYGGKGK